MIKKIKIVNHDNHCVRDTTIGKVYDATHDEVEDFLCFFDDEGDDVMIRVSDPAYKVVGEDQSMTNNNQVNWDEIPEDVEAVVTFEHMTPNYYKVVDNTLMIRDSKNTEWESSFYSKDLKVQGTFGNRFHLRPTPSTQPTPEPPESTQVETSEVDTTTTPEFDWSSVEDDVEAVILYKGKVVQHLKTGLSGGLLMNIFNEEGWIDCFYSTIEDRELFIKHYGDGTATLLRRPPATTPSSKNVTGKVGFYEGELPEGMIPLDTSSIQTETYTPKPPSISTILQEAQQSILKHHGVTGKVEFTVACSE